MRSTAGLVRGVRGGVLGSLALVAFAPAADAGPRPRPEPVRLGFTAEVNGVGCTSATLSREIQSSRVVRFQPAAGASADDLNTVQVTDVGVVNGAAVWTLSPTSEECAFWDGVSDWTWSTGERTWAATYSDSVRVIRASRLRGVRSIAGFRVNGRTRRSAPTVRKARRYFGRPSSRRKGDNFCRLRWRRLGLTITFATFGLGNPCHRGFVQSGRVRGGSAPWTAVIGGRPGVALGTTASYLDHLAPGGQQPRKRAWTLAEQYVPYGDGGYVPTLSARLSRRGRTRGFEFWVGAAGD